MGKTRERQDDSVGHLSARKRLRVSEDEIKQEDERPKSKKELRAEKKAARKAVQQESEPLSREEFKKEKQRVKKEERKRLLKERLREERREKKIRQQKRLNREFNAPKAKKHDDVMQKSDITKGETRKSKTKAKEGKEEEEVSMKVLSEVMHGSQDETGMTTTKLGVKYKDIVLGDGNIVKNKSLVSVQYKLTGGKFGIVIDSSKNFKFRVGKGEVIQGWDIGISGMREGGRRKLIIPPKAGYGSQDIGAGPGAILHFDITVLSVRGS